MRLSVYFVFVWRIFINEHGGNPNKRNGDEATALHLICQIGKRNKSIESKLRAECLALLLAWQGPILSQNGEPEKANVDAVDAVKSIFSVKRRNKI